MTIIEAGAAGALSNLNLRRRETTVVRRLPGRMSSAASDAVALMADQEAAGTLNDRFHDDAESIARSRIAQLLALDPNWDSYGSAAVSPDAAYRAAELVTSVVRQGLTTPAMLPTAIGGVDVEWQYSDQELSIHFSPETPTADTAYFLDRVIGEEWELLLGEATHEVEQALGHFLATG